LGKGGEKFDPLIVSNQIFNMTKTETTPIVKRSPLAGIPVSFPAFFDEGAGARAGAFSWASPRLTLTSRAVMRL
jgi:hypothetical protein